MEAEEPDWLDANGLELLRAAREAGRRAGLIEGNLLDLDDGVQMFPWVGTRTMRTLHLWARQNGLCYGKDILSLTFNDVSMADVQRHLAALAEDGADAVALATLMPNKQVERFDGYVDEWLLNRANATDSLDVPSAQEVARRTLAATEVLNARP